MKNKDFVEGVNIIYSYMDETEKEDYEPNPGHDQFWFGSFGLVSSVRDAERLIELGWFEDENSWSCFT